MAITVSRIEGDVMKVNAFLVQGPRGAALIDGMLTVSDARKVSAALDASGTELAGVAITHPLPDHYAGLAQILRDREVPIVATREVDAVIRRDDATKEAIVGPMMGPEWPDRRLLPNQIITEGDAVTLADLPLRVRSLGPGESFADTIWELDDGTVFAGDIASNGMHAYLADGQCEHWLAAIDRLERELPDGVILHVGHGPPAGKELLGRQRRYIETFVNALQRHADAAVTGNHTPVLTELRSVIPSEDLLFLADLSIEPMLATIGGAD